MKNPFVLALIGLSFVVRLTGFAQTAVVYEPFDYAPDQLLTAANTNWTLNGTGDDTFVVGGSLSINGLAASIGNSITNGGAGAAVRLPTVMTNSAGSIYASFAMRINSLGAAFTSGTAFIASFVDSSANGQQARLRIQNATGGYQLGIAKVTSTEAVFHPTVYSEGQTLFIVLRYTFNAGSASDDQADLWINPNPSTFGSAAPPVPTVAATLIGADIAQIDQFAFRQNTSGNTPAAITWDELRLGANWAAVTPAPPPVLSIARSGPNVVISWPTNQSTGFVLHGIQEFDHPGGWVTVANPVIVAATNNTVTVNADNATRLFRLEK